MPARPAFPSLMGRTPPSTIGLSGPPGGWKWPPGTGNTWPFSPPLRVPWGPPAPSRAPCVWGGGLGLGQGHTPGQRPPSISQTQHGLCSKNHVVKLEKSKTMVRATPAAFPPDLVVPPSGKNSRKGTWWLTRTWLGCGRMSGGRRGSGDLN